MEITYGKLKKKIQKELAEIMKEDERCLELLISILDTGKAYYEKVTEGGNAKAQAHLVKGTQEVLAQKFTMLEEHMRKILALDQQTMGDMRRANHSYIATFERMEISFTELFQKMKHISLDNQKEFLTDIHVMIEEIERMWSAVKRMR